ncbi:MAG TPA: branched-chain amino acid ABC transporter permease [Hyphomicrobiales bacterium]|nr:branched-chain amino acid ABC transporter permease [Hyphomicrobiales bacterium]
MIRRLVGQANARTLWALAALLAALIAAPAFANDYVLTVLVLALYYAYTGQAWNLMLGFAGLLSIGQAMFVGLGAYAAAGLFVQFGVPPIAGVFLSIVVACIAGAIVGYLAFRFAIGGVYFALLTIAFSEFTRILIDNWAYLGGSRGLFLKVSDLRHWDLINLRGPPQMFYYILLVLTVAVFLFCRYILNSKIGYYWQAIREDEEAAQAIGIDTFRYKIYAVVISSGISGIAGTIYAFYYNNLFPETVFAISGSVDMLLGTVVGGVGTLFGPIFGALILTPLGEALTAATASVGIPGIKQFFWGLVVAAIVLVQPAGLWPLVYRGLRLGGRRMRPPPVLRGGNAVGQPAVGREEEGV